MNPFERELRKIFEQNDVFDNVKFVGRTCVGTLGGGYSVKIEFVIHNTMDKYDGIKATVMNRNDGKLDSMTLWFRDVWGVKQTAHPNFPNGVIPYLRGQDGDPRWYVYQPTPQDMEVIAGQMRDYLDLFRGQTQESGHDGQMMR